MLQISMLSGEKAKVQNEICKTISTDVMDIRNCGSIEHSAKVSERVSE